MRFNHHFSFDLKIRIFGLLVIFFVDTDQKGCNINSWSLVFVHLQVSTTVRAIRVRTAESATCTRTATSAPATMVRKYIIEGLIVRVRSHNG